MLKRLLLTATLLALTACATTETTSPPGAPAIEPAPELVEPDADLPLALEALEKTRQRLDAQAARIEALRTKLRHAPAPPR